MQTTIVGIAEDCGNVFERGCVELSTLRERASLIGETEWRKTWGKEFAALLVALLAGAGRRARRLPKDRLRRGRPGRAANSGGRAAKLNFGMTLVNMPVTVRNAKGEMVHTLDERFSHHG